MATEHLSKPTDLSLDVQAKIQIKNPRRAVAAAAAACWRAEQTDA